MALIKKDGKTFEVFTNTSCKKCKKIEKHCKCAVKDFETQEISREIPEFMADIMEGKTSSISPVPKLTAEEMEVCPSCKKIRLRCICEKIARNEEIRQVLTAPEPDDEEEMVKSKEPATPKLSKEMEAIVEKRNEEAMSNVDAIVDLKKSLAASGASAEEVKKEVMKLKKKQKEALEAKKE